MRKIGILVAGALLMTGIILAIWPEESRELISPLLPAPPKPKPLLKYSFENLRQGEYPGSEIKLGGQPATRLNGDSVSPLVAAIDGNALVLIQGFFGEEPYWRPIYDRILASFEFIPLAKSGSSGASSGGVIEEEEEIIE